MGRGALAVLAVAVTLLNPSNSVKFPADDEEVTMSSRPKFRHDSSVHHAKEWIDGPDGHVYQFHVGDQSWLSAREFCLSQNSELVVLRSRAQIDWLLTHYAPTYARFNERYMQIGLMMPDGPNRDWTYLDGSRYNQSVIPWLSGEPFDHSADGRERCAILRVHARVLDDIDCEAAPSPNVHMRFVCERDQQIHKQQQKSQNFIWSKLEKLLEYFGFSSGTLPSAPPFNQSDSDEDYFDELKKMKITSKEREELKNIKIDRETSSEEQRAVESALKVLNKVSKPGTTATSSAPKLAETSRPTSQEDRPNTSGELLTGPTTLTSHTEESNGVSETSTVTEATEAPTTVTETTETPSTVVDTTTVPVEATTTVERTVAENTVVENSKTAKDAIVRARAAPLKEIAEAEASGAEVEKSQIEDSSKLRHEIDPEKLEKIITTMEKMIENLEKVHVKEVKKEEKKEEGEGKKEEKKEDSKKGLKKKGKSSESLVRIGEKDKEDAQTMSAMEKDFDEEANKKLPSTDIKPPEEDCDEEASGEKATSLSPTEEIINNTVDTEDVDDLSQKPKIPAEKEAHIQDFLNTLRTFLSRAEHSDLRKLLDEHPEKTLLEKMKLAIKAANEREFERLKELELMKKHGVDISRVPEPKLMGENEREELYKKISRVVMVEAEKKGEETVTQPSARTTTQELYRAKIREVRSKEVLIRKSSKEFISKDKADEKLKDVTPVSTEDKAAEQEKEEEVEKKKKEKKEEKDEKKKEENKEQKVEEKKDENKEEKVEQNKMEKKEEKVTQTKEEKEEEQVKEKKEEKDEKKVEQKKAEKKEEKATETKEEKKEENVAQTKEEKKEEKVDEKKEEKKEGKAEEKKDEMLKKKEDEKKEEGTTTSTEGPVQNETTTAAESSAEIPLRTVQLKEFDNKEEIMSKESKPDVKESGEIKERRKIEDRSEEEEEKPKDDKDFVKTEALTTNDLENQGNDESDEEEKKNEEEDEVRETSPSPSETNSNEAEADKTDAGEENEKKEEEKEESSKTEGEEENEKKEEENDKADDGEGNDKKEGKEEKEDKKKKKKNKKYVKTERMTVDDLRDVDTYQSEEEKITEPQESGDADSEEKKPKGKNYVKTERLSPNDLRNQPNDSDEAKEVSDEEGDEPKEVSAYPPDPNSEPQDIDDDDDLTTQDTNDSVDSEHEDKSNQDDSFDSDQVDRSLNILKTKPHKEPFEDSVSTVRMPVEEDEDKGVEVGTVKTPEGRRAEKRRLEKAKRKKDRVAKDAPKPKSTDAQDDDPDDPEDDAKDSVENPFNLPTLPTLPTLPPPGHPPPTLPPITPIPGLDNLLQTMSAQWRQIFPKARIPTFNPDE
ncbi:hypothetical protein Aduo_013682 [Ancylostoma duodenale]